MLDCACYCKDTHFEAIHNLVALYPSILRIVLATAKIHILKQFTTKTDHSAETNLLCLLLQRYTFWSNSQHQQKDSHKESIVLATAKIHILKQFTTADLGYQPVVTLCLLLQRYTFWSNSQRRWSSTAFRRYCACYCKDTHFEAIHNSLFISKKNQPIVLATAKIHILKQFTTTEGLLYQPFKLCLLLQRYTFWSNSQRDVFNPKKGQNCACYCKDTHFEAIHNSGAFSVYNGLLCLLLQRYTFWSNSQLADHRHPIGQIVLATAKIHILKQFTTESSWYSSLPALCLLLQRYTFWSNSQLRPCEKSPLPDCACYCKDTHFEAIHNHELHGNIVPVIVLATAKIHILKQFTTPTVRSTSRPTLCLLLQRYTFWSNSQLSDEALTRGIYCACYCKDTHFEAIHNRLWTLSLMSRIVLATAKIHILKQFTTSVVYLPLASPLCLLLQRYTFWSNSQPRKTIQARTSNCACYCKDTHFEAIHNIRTLDMNKFLIVLATAKIHILKQFTTRNEWWRFG